jgi:hypothetical protein
MTGRQWRLYNLYLMLVLSSDIGGAGLWGFRLRPFLLSLGVGWCAATLGTLLCVCVLGYSSRDTT